ncbi:MAG TPA: di-heme oxidoredictase family protein [Verrucomicrobiae bacterium]|nr:di-heme oxidoredictase family protein [Verrucomicrobiae bacterium]
MKLSFFSQAAMLGALIVCTATSWAQPVLSIQPGVSLSWTTKTNNSYQPEWLAGSGGAWNPLEGATAGDGTTNSLFDPAPANSRSYQVMEITPGSPASAIIPTNGGFETGNGPAADGWSVTTAAGGPVYAVRTNANPHGGSYHFEVHLASTGAGPVVQFSQAGIPVVGGTAYPLSFYANALTGSSSYNAQWRVLWNAGGDTGYQTFTPGNNTYALISQTVTAPASATAATIFLHFAGAAIPSAFATIDLDDIALGSASGAASPGGTNMIPVTVQPAAKVSWPTTAGVEYQPASATNLAGAWNTNFPIVSGDGSVQSVLFPATNNPAFFRVYIPAVVTQPPANFHASGAGSTNSIGLAWTASTSPGITGYRILYGSSSDGLTNSMTVGNVNSAIVSGLTFGQTYYFQIIALTAGGESAATAIFTASPQNPADLVPLFDSFTTLEPDTVSNTPTALITWLGDRARDRHAREAQFMLYDHYLSWYWEQRVDQIQIVDHVAKGGSDITFNYTTQDQLNPAEFRTFFRGITTVAEYQNNQQATLVSSNVSVLFPGEMDFNYTAKITANAQFNRPLQLGDRVEIEISQFLLNPRHGRDNYYGTVLLYVVGQGIMPWEEGQDLGLTGGIVGTVNQNLDSYPLPTNAWLGGGTTLPYQYSNEPTNHFKELAGNISPLNAELFMLGRRLHHTDFGDGSHSEPDNPIYTEQIGKLGPKFVNRSCVACHVNNGRALPPTIGAPMLQSVVKVGSDATGTPDPVLGSELQPQSTSGAGEGSVTISSYTTVNGQYGDGTPYTLQKPNYTFQGVAPQFYSVRLAPQLVGLGLLEAVSEQTIQAGAGSGGTAGRMAIVTDPQTGQQRVGRFNYKAGKARLSHQVAGALNNDMGVTTSIFPMLDGDTGTNGAPELSDSDLDKMTRYIALLGVSARRGLTNASALHGEQLFASANCVSCHTPTLTTSPYHPFAELRNQTIHPYTDLLLHDMGPGLADNMGEGNATGAEWRTAPLWNIGLTAAVSGGEAYLHDGRARSLAEAILWHDGDGTAAKEAFRTMSAADRADLIAFLQSL